ncbi:uncharacterized protein C8A04DRAFT_24773 [Dichotomopilus funicola]|uniref:Uncharacterized protein n=1 Tax=Dichotomopilus funicola TaxID=1934379 RepID=A0AAN6ZRN0_9PEZI|nr:hypothetical protein C8A04DRAFT_24773 [Dichotomopilus funicola]
MLRTTSHSFRLPLRSFRAPAISSFTQQHRPYHLTARCLLPYKDDQDRQSLNPRRSEGTKSASDDEVAEKSDAAFNPRKTSPEAEHESAGKESNGNPLEASGANQELSRPKSSSQQRSGEEGKKEKSGGSGGKKAGKVAPM